MRNLTFVRARSAIRTDQILGKAAQLGRLAELPAVDPDDVIEDFGDVHDAPPLTYHIVYQDSRGHRSGRVITVRSIRKEFGEVRVGAYCHARNAFRGFLASRIIEVTDLHTGEVFEDALTFFGAHAITVGPSADTTLSLETLAMQECRDEVAILCVVAEADGDFAEAERDVIIRHVMDRCPDEGMSEKEIRKRVNALHPTEHSYLSGLGRLCKGEGDPKALMRSLRKLVDADGELDPEEVTFATEIQGQLEAAGRL